MQTLSPVTYHLAPEGKDEFYRDLSAFTDRFLAGIDGAINDDLSRFRRFIRQSRREEPRSLQEYLIEFLAMGIFYRLYSGCAANSCSLLMSSLNRLFRLRTNYPQLKQAIDAIRGMLITQLHYDDEQPAPCSFNEFERLLSWLDATGDFREEVLRLRHWQAYLATLTEDRATALLTRAMALADRFSADAHLALGRYTHNVDIFLSESHPAYKQREDYVFCGRREAEYHLNMVGAEILNRALRHNFTRTRHKAVLLPTCMCAPDDGICKARHQGLEITCAGCTADCPVNRQAAALRREGVATYLIPHSSSFTKVLERWKDHTDVGLVGVACVLNLLTGGYEMMKLGIPAQCVFLDYCGCRKHWRQEGIPTDLNTEQLLKAVAPTEREAAVA